MGGEVGTVYGSYKDPLSQNTVRMDVIVHGSLKEPYRK